jgi:uncharacterized membrane protein YjjB (DUF3815 family)
MIMRSLYAFIATLGFGVLFNIRGKNLFFASLGGGLAWLMYALFYTLNFSSVSALFLASIVIGLYSEVMARLLKTPVTTYAICALIPLVPGSGMYHTMLQSVLGNIDESLSIGLHTISSAGALALGVVLTSSLSRLISTIQSKKRKL